METTCDNGIDTADNDHGALKTIHGTREIIKFKVDNRKEVGHSIERKIWSG